MLLSCSNSTNPPKHFTDKFEYKDKEGNESVFYGFKNLDSARYWATVEKKKMLVIFSGYACVSVPNQDWKTLTRYGDNKKIQDNFIIVWLAVDDKRIASDTNQTVLWYGKERKLITIGDHNKYLEEITFKNSSQPLLCLLDSLKKPLGKTLGYTPDKKDVEEFINSGLTN